MAVEEIIVLANSLKMRGRCVAGVSVQTGKWVRPVSDLEHGELYPSQMGGRQPQLLEVVRFHYQRETPEPEQPENVLLDDHPWEVVARLDPDSAYAELAPFLVSGPELLGNREAGVPEEQAEAGMEASLALIEPEEEVCFRVRERRRLEARAFFALDGQQYDLPVTDPLLKGALLGMGIGSYDAEDVSLDGANHTLITASLGPSFRGTNWKLVAACLAVS